GGAVERQGDRAAVADDRMALAVNEQPRRRERQVAAPGVGFAAVRRLYRDQGRAIDRHIERAPGFDDLAAGHVGRADPALLHRTRLQAGALEGDRTLVELLGTEADRLRV